MIFGALLSAIGSLAGLAGAGGQDNSASIAASVQNQKLQSATDRLNQSVAANQQAGENRLNTILQTAGQQNMALDKVVDVLRQSILKNL